MAFDEDWEDDATAVAVIGLGDIRKILERIAVALEEMNLVVQEQRDSRPKDAETKDLE